MCVQRNWLNKKELILNTTSRVIKTSSCISEEHDLVKHHQEQFPIIGTSASALRTKQQIQFAKEMNVSVFITGEKGTEKTEVAQYIHDNRLNINGKLIRLSPNFSSPDVYKLYLKKAITDAQSGTLLLEDIDELSREIQDFLIYAFTIDGYQEKLNKQNVSLMVSCNTSIYSLKESNAFLSVLLECNIPYMEINISPLSERKEDIPELITHVMKKFDLQEGTSITEGAQYLLNQYHWPGNLTQLRSLLVLLASCSYGEITEQDVLSVGVIKKTDCSYDIFETILERRFERLENLHPALKKALIYLGENYTESIKLTDMASASYTSPSHLSFLFREHLNLSFKGILVRVRIQRAKQLFDASPMLKVTDVCLQSGFGDLSHFEKMFKRYAGCTPRQYRAQNRQRPQFSLAV